MSNASCVVMNHLLVAARLGPMSPPFRARERGTMVDWEARTFLGRALPSTLLLDDRYHGLKADSIVAVA